LRTSATKKPPERRDQAPTAARVEARPHGDGAAPGDQRARLGGHDVARAERELEQRERGTVGDLVGHGARGRVCRRQRLDLIQ
jgi:hypothetical protein